MKQFPVRLKSNGENTTNFMGFEWDNKTAAKIMNDPEAVAVLVQIRKTGVAIMELDSGSHKGIRAMLKTDDGHVEMFRSAEYDAFDENHLCGKIILVGGDNAHAYWVG